MLETLTLKIMASIVGFPAFAAYFLTITALIYASLWIYTKITPYSEWELFNTGNITVALILGGVFLGLVIPAAGAIFFSKNLIDAILWTTVSVSVQLLTYVIMNFKTSNLKERVEADDKSVGILFAAVSIGIAILQVASMSY